MLDYLQLSSLIGFFPGINTSFKVIEPYPRTVKYCFLVSFILVYLHCHGTWFYCRQKLYPFNIVFCLLCVFVFWNVESGEKLITISQKRCYTEYNIYFCLNEKLSGLPVLKNVDLSANIATNITINDPHAIIYHWRYLISFAPEIYFHQKIEICKLRKRATRCAAFHGSILFCL